MALSANTIFEIRSTATAGNVNGGGFVTGATGTNFSRQNAAQYNLTGATSSGAGNVILHASAAADMVGNIAKAISGTNVTVGWFEILSVDVGVSITFSTNAAGASIATGVAAAGVINVGGALSLGASDDAVFENAVAGVKFYVKGGATYTLGGAVTIAAAGGTQLPILIEGYDVTQGDIPQGSTRPTFACGTSAFTLGAQWDMTSIILTGTAASVLNLGSNSKARRLKITNSGTAANQNALQSAANGFALSCELISYRGNGVSGSAAMEIIGCYIHDCNVGINSTSTANATTYLYNIVEGCVTAAIRFTAAKTVASTLHGNTLYGAENKLGIGVSIASGTTNARAFSNIIYGFTTGIVHADVQSVSLSNYNAFYNNTTDTTNWATGANCWTTLAPGFGSVRQVLVTTATTSNVGNTLVKAGATFVTSGVTAGRDYVYISSTSGTAGIYGIVSVDSETQLTLDLAPGASTGDVSAQITTGKNFTIGSALKALGMPATFPGGYTTAYTDIGAAQRKERNNAPKRLG